MYRGDGGKSECQVGKSERGEREREEERGRESEEERGGMDNVSSAEAPAGGLSMREDNGDGDGVSNHEAL